MADEGTPPEPPRFPVADDPGSAPPNWPPEAPTGPPSWPPDYAPPPYGPTGWGYQPPPSYGGRPPHWLHPLHLSRALSSAWRLFRFNWRPMVGLIAVTTLPIAVISALYTAIVEGPALAAWQDAYEAAILSGNFANLPPAPASSAGSLILSLISALLSVIAVAGVVHIIGAAYRGKKEGAGAGARAALGRIWSLLGGTILLILAFIGIAVIIVLAAIVLFSLGFAVGGRGLGVFIGLIGAVGAIAAFVFFALRWSMLVQAIMLDGLGAVAALRRSWRLVHGSTWRVLGYVLAVALILVGVELAVGIPLIIVAFVAHMATHPGGGLTAFVSASTDPIYLLIVIVGGGLLEAFVLPWWLAVLTLLYYDLRWQRGEPDPGAPSA